MLHLVPGIFFESSDSGNMLGSEMKTHFTKNIKLDVFHKLQTLIYLRFQHRGSLQQRKLNLSTSVSKDIIRDLVKSQNH